VDDFIAFDFRLTAGEQPLDDVYVGFFADSDIGPRESDDSRATDMAGFWEGDVLARVGRPRPDRESLDRATCGTWTATKARPRLRRVALPRRQEPGSDTVPRPISMRNFRYFSGNGSFDGRVAIPTNDDER